MSSSLPRRAIYDSAGNPLSSTVVGLKRGLNVNIIGDESGGGGGGAAPKTFVALARHVYSTPVTTTAYVQLVASLPDAVTQMYVFDSSGKTLVLAIGAPGTELDRYYIVPGGNGLIELSIASGERVSVKAVSGNADKAATELSITFLK